ncbi:MAG: leucyl/phenylalanyl-tRNA--protein transferase [Casimicrobiaceae bacterium]|nr:leucyl/phenylalanyl-tRNA--protein transferase [Casimicrobiaceae bacterium]
MRRRGLLWLEPGTPFPDPELALTEPNGLLCAGLELTPERILEAYPRGIFPWFSDGQPVLWWSPDPRMVLYPKEFRLHRSLRKTLRRGLFTVTADEAFAAVIHACAEPRPDQDGTWITPEMIAVYTELHRRGVAHSVEVWLGGELAGGLYGLALGRVFFGESMFARITDASKVALAHLVAQLERWGFGLIDCQQQTRHLASLGARPIARRVFIDELARLLDCEMMASAPSQTPALGRWVFDSDLGSTWKPEAAPEQRHE